MHKLTYKDICTLIFEFIIYTDNGKANIFWCIYILKKIGSKNPSTIIFLVYELLADHI